MSVSACRAWSLLQVLMTSASRHCGERGEARERETHREVELRFRTYSVREAHLAL